MEHCLFCHQCTSRPSVFWVASVGRMAALYHHMKGRSGATVCISCYMGISDDRLYSPTAPHRTQTKIPSAPQLRVTHQPYNPFFWLLSLHEFSEPCFKKDGCLGSPAILSAFASSNSLIGAAFLYSWLCWTVSRQRTSAHGGSSSIAHAKDTFPALTVLLLRLAPAVFPPAQIHNHH